MDDNMYPSMYGEAIAAKYGVPADAVRCYVEALAGLEIIGDVSYALDTATMVLYSAEAGADDEIIDATIAAHTRARYRGRHRR
jgi:hypothetical protein